MGIFTKKADKNAEIDDLYSKMRKIETRLVGLEADFEILYTKLMDGRRKSRGKATEESREQAGTDILANI